ncbi:uncharacterized protein LOC128999522 [Macrosteles quadrilineatus]|uniref:uncharacterized protein LOC128999522 n=1 Tax=Macrosteles quadrilineatus TaxID=74068 RepID=UPI0023E11F4B|nr:uncharacterized protein LOC128999522 [Macrosteles quadrilineatus]
MANCRICVKNVTSKQLKLKCNDCEGIFHAACLNFSKADVECVTTDNLVWRCNDCSATRRKSLRFESEASGGKLSMEDLMKVVMEIRDSQKDQEKSFNTAYEAMNLQLEDNNKALKAQNEQNEKLLKLIESITAENVELKNRVKFLEERVDNLEQHSRVNCLEIQGIPQTPTEDVLSIVKEIGKAIDMKIDDTMVDTCHRLGSRQNDRNSPPGIIVKFVRRMDKEEFMRKKRVKRTLSTRHIGRPDDHAIYINESLSPARRKLYAMARTYRKEKNFQFLWVRNGKIFLRKSENETVKVITSQNDLK